MITAKQVAKLAQICAEINRKPTNQEETGNNPKVIFMFFGHPHGAELRVHYSGWEEGEFPDCIYMFFDRLGWWKRNAHDLFSYRVTFGQIMHDLQKLKERRR